jgi:hypothetical protein
VGIDGKGGPLSNRPPAVRVARTTIALVFVAVFVTVFVTAGCTQPTPTSPPTDTSLSIALPTEASHSAVTPLPDTSSRSSSPSAAAKQWTMPNMIGNNLQQAQDQMQKLTGDPVFVTLSHDATGQKRNQLVDRNWKVCSQNVPPGQPLTLDSKIDFGAVKVAEPCPS